MFTSQGFQLHPDMIYLVAKKSCKGKATICQICQVWYQSHFCTTLQLIQNLYYVATQVKAIRPYRAKDDLELSLRPGDIIDVTESDNKHGWWTGILHEETGIFPKECVEIVSTVQVCLNLLCVKRKRIKSKIINFKSVDTQYCLIKKLMHFLGK